MKIKVIDLLNKIANKEEVPKKIKYDGIEFVYNEWAEDYENIRFCKSYVTERIFKKNIRLGLLLNEEIEIVEDNKKIEHCIGFQHFENYDDYIEYLRTKIDELIDEINKLKEK